MVAAVHNNKELAAMRLQKSVRQVSQKIRAEWTPEERAWRSTMAAQKLAELASRLITPGH